MRQQPIVLAIVSLFLLDSRPCDRLRTPILSGAYQRAYKANVSVDLDVYLEPRPWNHNKFSKSKPLSLAVPQTCALGARRSRILLGFRLSGTVATLAASTDTHTICKRRANPGQKVASSWNHLERFFQKKFVN